MRQLITSTYRASRNLKESSLEQNAVYTALLTNDPGRSWHWAIYFHQPHTDANGVRFGGYKMHATNRSGTWKYECISLDILATFTLTVIAKIGAIHNPEWGVEFLDEYLRAIPMSVPDGDRDPTFSCLTWFRQAIRVLHNEQFCVKCSDVDALERELSSRARIVDAQFTPGPMSPFFEAKNARPLTPDLD